MVLDGVVCGPRDDCTSCRVVLVHGSTIVRGVDALNLGEFRPTGLPDRRMMIITVSQCEPAIRAERLLCAGGSAIRCKRVL